MRYIPKKAPDDVNVSKEHPLVEASTLIVGLSLIFLAIALVLVLMVDIVLLFVSPEREAEMFSNWRPDDFVASETEDPRLDALRELTARLAAHWEDSPYEFRIEVSDDSNLNAVALPGGLIVVTSGLLNTVESENELAFVIGHEIGHFRNRDHIRGLGRGVVLSILIAAISGADGSADLGPMLGDLALRSFSRGQESEADEFALEIVHKEYGHLDEAWRFFERIDSDNEFVYLLTAYVSTHPAPDDRIDRLRDLARARVWSVEGETTPLAW
ncbi:MAG: M48 family metallopeptidase [Woeseiaceae bacterium]|nr:M48 family metallopeptidase [Woeseiaceae bacterium]